MCLFVVAVNVEIVSEGCGDLIKQGITDCSRTIATIKVNNIERSHNARGYNFAVFDFQTGKL